MEHKPVLLQEVIKYLDPKPGGKFIDATVGMGGHAIEIIKLGGYVLGIDEDPSTIEYLRKNFQFPISNFQINSKFQIPNSKFVQGNFSEIKEIAEREGFTEVDGILFDLGMGSWQLDDPARGFSFQREGPLDMRYNPSSPHPLLLGRRGRKGEEAMTAADVVNKYSEKELIRIFKEYGEERRFGKKIARSIVENRKIKPFETTTELFNLIKHPDTSRRIFQALRIEVNQELANLEKALPQAVELLKGSKGGRLVVISFHSLEDRIVKNFFKEQAKDCICPPEFPECRCDAQAKLRILTKKPITASAEETKINPRAKSAKLRAAMKL